MVTWQDPTHETGVASDRSTRGNQPGRSNAYLARSRKASAALSLRLSGASWAEIAQTLGYPTPRAALLATEKALVKQLETEGDREQMRGMAGARLERLLRAVWMKAIDTESPDQFVAVSRAREIIADHRKLFGMDAPTEIVVHSPTKSELENWVLQVVSTGIAQVEEPDIFDIEEVPEIESGLGA